MDIIVTLGPLFVHFFTTFALPQWIQSFVVPANSDRNLGNVYVSYSSSCIFTFFLLTQCQTLPLFFQLTIVYSQIFILNSIGQWYSNRLEVTHVGHTCCQIWLQVHTSIIVRILLKPLYGICSFTSVFALSTILALRSQHGFLNIFTLTNLFVRSENYLIVMVLIWWDLGTYLSPRNCHTTHQTGFHFLSRIRTLGWTNYPLHQYCHQSP